MFAGFKVSGFRSLDRFTLPLQFGVNALVGPNGAGKTNALEAISFAGAVVSGSLETAFAQHGGVSSIFARTSDGDFRNSMRFTVSGLVAARSRDKSTKQNVFLGYDYSFSIRLGAGLKPYIHKQVFELNDLTDAILNGEAIDSEPRVVFSIKEEKRNNFRIHIFDENKVGAMSIRAGESGKIKPKLMERLRERQWGGETLLEALSPFMHAAHRVRRSSADIRLLSVVPGKVRAGDDIGVPPTIRPDGSGLPTVLYALQNGSMPGFSVAECDDLLGQIQDLLCLAVPSVSSVVASVDKPTGRVRLVFHQSREDGSLEVPVSASDGTIKWLVLVTSLLTEHVFLVEEPENYLHPWMQREYIELMRNHGGPFPGYIFSTHSETILNALEPSEVIIVNHNGLKTIAKRVGNPHSLQRAIDDTGFGLGFYYLTGGLE